MQYDVEKDKSQLLEHRGKVPLLSGAPLLGVPVVIGDMATREVVIDDTCVLVGSSLAVKLLEEADGRSVATDIEALEVVSDTDDVVDSVAISKEAEAAKVVVAAAEVVFCTAEVALAEAVVLPDETLLFDDEAPPGAPPAHDPRQAAIYPAAG